ncbi:MAG: hypothetical protein AB2L20_22375 [Mangrovibacterium sp.]
MSVYKNIERKIILHHHLGIGDHFVCNGLVNYLSLKFEKIYLICKDKHLPTISYLYADNNMVTLLPVYENEYRETLAYALSYKLPVLRVGFDQCNLSDWNRSFYKQLQIPYKYRYTYFSIPKQLPQELISVPNEKFIAVHNQSSQCEFKIRLPTNITTVVYITKEACPNLLSFLPVLQNAEEIHCIDSAVFHLADGLTNITSKLYFHDVRDTGECKMKLPKKWKRISYR